MQALEKWKLKEGFASILMVCKQASQVQAAAAGGFNSSSDISASRVLREFQFLSSNKASA